MQNEFDWFSSEFQKSLLYSEPVQFIEWVIIQTHHWLFVQTGIQSWLDNPNNSEWGAWIYHYLRDYIESVLYVIITFIIRLMIIVLISLLFLLVALVGGEMDWFSAIYVVSVWGVNLRLNTIMPKERSFQSCFWLGGFICRSLFLFILTGFLFHQRFSLV